MLANIESTSSGGRVIQLPITVATKPPAKAEIIGVSSHTIVMIVRIASPAITAPPGCTNAPAS